MDIDETTTVDFCCSTNSTMFCNNCGNAVCRDEKYCSSCKRKVEPEDYGARWKRAMRKYKK